MDIHIWQRVLTRDDIVLRGCQREPAARLLTSMRDHHESPRTDGEWGLSVAAVPGSSELETLIAAKNLKQSHYRVGTVAYFNDMGLLVIWDHRAHGLIISPSEPTLGTTEQIARGFGDPKPNPFYEERRGRDAHR